MRFVRHRHPAAHALALRRDLLDQREEGQVETDVLVLGVVDDVDDLLGEQARVDGMAHRTHAGHRVVDLEMAEPVPGQGADTIRRPHAERGQGVGQLTRALVGLGIRVSVYATFDQARHDFGVAVEAVRMADQRRDLQGHIHHQTVHDFLLIVSLASNARILAVHRASSQESTFPSPSLSARIGPTQRYGRVRRGASRSTYSSPPSRQPG